MAKITFITLTTGSITSINANFAAVATELQDKVLYRDNPVGEPNQMENDLDMNSNDLLNVQTTNTQELYINGVLTLPAAVAEAELPSMVGQSTKVLSNDSVNPLWIDRLPDQTGNSGKHLVTNGTVESWEATTFVTVNTVAEMTTDPLAVVGRSYVCEARNNGVFDVISGTGTANGYNIIAHSSLSLSFVLRVGKEIDLCQWGAVADGVTDDAAVIDNAFYYMAANAQFSNTLVFTSGRNFAVSSVTLNSGLPLEFKAYGAYITLLAHDVPAFLLRIDGGRWRGGHVRTSDGASTFHPIFIALQNETVVTNTGKFTFQDIEARNIYRCIYVYMTTGGGASNFRHRFLNCKITNFSNGAKLWAGSYGIRLDGDTNGDSAGNDTQLIGTEVIGYETGLFTNGFGTKMIGGAVDGNYYGVTLSGATVFTSTNVYFEYNEYCYNYTNLPADPISHACTYGVIGIAFAAGVLGVGNYTAHHGVNNIGGPLIINAMGATKLKTNTTDVLDIDSTSGKQVIFRNSGTEIGSIKDSLLSLGTLTPLGFHQIFHDVTQDNDQISCQIGHSGAPSSFYSVSGTGASSANTAFKVQKDNVTNRSINAAGTVNASGADYAEYMEKAYPFTCKAGDILGINDEGKLVEDLTQSHSYALVSSDPSFVGNDKFESGSDVEIVVFCGDAPANVSGNAGEFVIVDETTGNVVCTAKPTWEQYINKIGKVMKVVNGVTVVRV